MMSSHPPPSHLYLSSHPHATAFSATTTPITSAPRSVPTSPAPAPVTISPDTMTDIAPRTRSSTLVNKLTVGLMTTYNAINEKYYANKKKKELAGQKSSSSSSSNGPYNQGYDDKEYNYIIQASENLNHRYVVDQSIGKGSFGRVVRAYDKVDREYVAIKIVKSKPAFYKQAQVEINILSSLQQHTDKWNIVHMKDTFMHHQHQCIVFELLSINLYELLRNTRFQGVSLKLIAKFAYQLLNTLGHLASKERVTATGGDRRVIHCDLKPENILLRNPKKSAIKVIDFGSACFSHQKAYTYIQSRFYRAPEVLLNLPYNNAIDMWSLGCILVEMHTGKPLFDGLNEADQLVKQMEILGMPPNHMLDGNKKADKFFEKEEGVWRLRNKWQVTPNQSLKAALGSKYQDTPIYHAFIDFIMSMLTYDAKQRIRPSQALQHPFLQITLVQTGDVITTPTSGVSTPIITAIPTMTIPATTSSTTTTSSALSSLLQAATTSTSTTSPSTSTSSITSLSSGATLPSAVILNLPPPATTTSTIHPSSTSTSTSTSTRPAHTPNIPITNPSSAHPTPALSGPFSSSCPSSSGTTQMELSHPHTTHTPSQHHASFSDDDRTIPIRSEDHDGHVFHMEEEETDDAYHGDEDDTVEDEVFTMERVRKPPSTAATQASPSKSAAAAQKKRQALHQERRKMPTSKINTTTTATTTTTSSSSTPTTPGLNPRKRPHSNPLPQQHNTDMTHLTITATRRSHYMEEPSPTNHQSKRASIDHHVDHTSPSADYSSHTPSSTSSVSSASLSSSYSSSTSSSSFDHMQDDIHHYELPTAHLTHSSSHYQHTSGPIAAVHSPKFALPQSRSPASTTTLLSHQSSQSSSTLSSSTSSAASILPRPGVRTRSFVRQSQIHASSNSLPAPLTLSASSSSSNSSATSGRSSPHPHGNDETSTEQHQQQRRAYHTRSKSSSSPHGTSPHLVSSNISTPRDAHQAHHHFHLSSSIPTIQLSSHSPESPIDSIAARTRSQVAASHPHHDVPGSDDTIAKHTRSQDTSTHDFGTNLTALFSTVHVHSSSNVSPHSPLNDIQQQQQQQTPYALRSHKKSDVQNKTEALYHMRSRG